MMIYTDLVRYFDISKRENWKNQVLNILRSLKSSDEFFLVIYTLNLFNSVVSKQPLASNSEGAKYDI